MHRLPKLRAACGECDSHRGVSMIHVDYLDRKNTSRTAPMVCMHCDEPTCALVCPADAIKKGEDGVVRSARSLAASPAPIAFWLVRSECQRYISSPS